MPLPSPEAAIEDGPWPFYFPEEYGSKISEGEMRQEGKGKDTKPRNEEGAQLLGCDKDQLEPAETQVALRIVWSLTFSSLYLHCRTKKQPPYAMEVPRRAIKGQKVGSGLIPGKSLP